MKITVLATFLVALVIGCVPTTTKTLLEEDLEFEKKLSQIMKTWEGNHISSLIQKIGPATQTATDGSRGTIYIYRLDPDSVPNANSEFVDIRRSRQRMLAMKMMYYTRPNGIIYLTKIDSLMKQNEDKR